MVKEFFWIVLTDLPQYCYTMEVGLKLAKTLDSCQVLQLREDQSLGTNFFHFRELIAINKLLKWVLHIFAPNGSIHARLIKYERLPNFCFCCGIIWHQSSNFSLIKEGPMEVKDMAYGPWMWGVDYVPSYQLFSMADPSRWTTIPQSLEDLSMVVVVNSTMSSSNYITPHVVP